MWTHTGPGGPVDVPTWRYYPSLVTLGNGHVMALDGNTFLEDQQECPNSFSGNGNVPAVWSVLGETPPGGSDVLGAWTLLDNAEYYPEYVPDAGQGDPTCPAPAPEHPHRFALGWYPFWFVLGDGSLFYAGFSDQADCSDFACTDAQQRSAIYMTRLLDPTRSMWQDVGATPIVGQTAVLYQKRVGGEVRTLVTKAGGNGQNFGVNSAVLPESFGERRVFTIDVTNTSSLNWVEDDPMPEPRQEFYLVALPSGHLLASPGISAPYSEGTCPADPNDPGQFSPVLRPALYDPQAAPGSRWTSMDAPVASPRVHHHTTLLLPDGSVWSAGGDYPSEGCLKLYQIYKPPYFFQGARPEIVGVPASAVYGTWFNVDVSVSAGSITAVRLIRPGAATHSFDQDQRMLELEYSVLDSDTIRVKAPQNGNVAPPGYYLLFVATGTNGTLPSEGKFIRIRSYLSPP